MRPGVVVERVHDVVGVRTGERVSQHILRALAPLGRSNQDDGLTIVLPNHGNHLVGVGFDGIPIDAVGFVADFVDDVLFAGVGLGHRPKKINGVRQPLVWIAGVEHVPVDDAVNTSLRGPVDNLVDFGPQPTLVVEVTALVDVHGGPEQVGSPVAGQRLNGPLRVALIEPLQTVRADTPQLHRSTGFVGKLFADQLEPTISREGRRRLRQDNCGRTQPAN